MTTSIVYEPSPTCERFMQSDAFIRIIMGPFGSGKSTACIMELWRRAMEQPPDPNGVRRSQWAIVRTTARQLLDTTMVSWLKWFPDGVAGTMHKTNKTFSTEYALGDGTTVKADYMFRALDDAADVKNLASLELNGAYFNELKETHKDIFDTMKGRVGRFVPQGVDPELTPVLKLIIADTNPPIESEHDWTYMLMEHSANDAEYEGKIAVFKQPSGLSAEAENLKYLPKNYYEDMCIGASPDLIRMNVHGLYGEAMGGKAVYGKSFSKNLHVAKEPLKAVRYRPADQSPPIIVGMDFGLTPAAALFQLQDDGRVFLLDELVSERSGLRQFLRNQLKPLLASRYPGLPVLIVGDPAGRAASGNDESTSYDILAERGFEAMPASTNSPVARIGAVEDKLCHLIDGQPALQISPHCTNVIRGMAFGYRYKDDNALGDAYHASPIKNMHSHVQDAVQYGCLHIDEAGRPVDTEDDDNMADQQQRNAVTGY